MTSEEWRLDQLLQHLGLVTSRNQAQQLIREKLVEVDGIVRTKPGQKFLVDAVVKILGEVHPYVSRGGLKLAGAIDAFNLEIHGMTALDIGAGTGGFTDCLLQNGAKRVYAVDVGTDQLADSLRKDERVVFQEGVHIKEFSAREIDDTIDIIVVDVSFISLIKIVGFLPSFAKRGTHLVALFKPQFEVGKEFIGKRGIVRADAPIQEAQVRVVSELEKFGFKINSQTLSPIKGGEGNQEILIHAVYE